MSEALKYLINTVITLGVCIVFFRYCNNTGTNTTTNTIEKTIQQIYDSTPKIIIPKIPASTQTFCFMPVPQDVDTAAILRQFFAVNTHYQQFEDSAIRAQVFDTICQNKIIKRGFSYQLLRPVRTIESSTVTINPRGLYAGGFAFAGKQSFGIGPQVSFLTRQEYLFTGGFDLINKQVLVGAQIKLHARGNR